MRNADHTPSSAEVKKGFSYTSTHPVGPPGPVTGFSPTGNGTNTERAVDKNIKI